jgi:heme/copper-type cytochrome/quinol oxidase subunit 2
MRQVAILVAAGAVVVGTLAGCGHQQPAASAVPGTGAARGAPAPAPPAVRTISVTVHGGKVNGETGRVTVPLGTPVVVAVSSDVADEIHVHGYDRKAKVPAGTTAAVTFTANNPGVFEVELEDSKLQLLQLQVS